MFTCYVILFRYPSSSALWFIYIRIIHYIKSLFRAAIVNNCIYINTIQWNIFYLLTSWLPYFRLPRFSIANISYFIHKMCIRDRSYSVWTCQIYYSLQNMLKLLFSRFFNISKLLGVYSLHFYRPIIIVFILRAILQTSWLNLISRSSDVKTIKFYLSSPESLKKKLWKEGVLGESDL